MKKTLFKYAAGAFLCILAAACSEEEIHQATGLPNEENADFYVLNEGIWGSNNSTLDFYDKQSAQYVCNIFPTINPGVTLGLGDTGNDLQIYGDKLYAVMNGSNLIEIMDKNTAKHLKSIKINAPRNIAFAGDYAYVTSYSSPVGATGGKGCVLKISTASLEILDTCATGRQPEALAAYDGKLYITNSGGYLSPAYERHISVVDLSTFTEVEKIEIADNINRIVADESGMLYVGSAGDYVSTSPALYIYDTKLKSATDTLHVAPSQLWLDGEKLYILGTDYITYSQTLVCYDTRTKTLNESPFPEAVSAKFTAPYAIAVHPRSKEIFITDAKDFTSLGMIYCLSPDGTTIRWESTAGIMPGHVAFR